MYIQTKDLNFIEVEDSNIEEITHGKSIMAVDFDGVISNPYGLKAYYLKERGYDIPEEETSPLLCLKHGVPPEIHEYAIKKSFLTSPKKLPLQEDFLAYFRKIRTKKIAVFIITSRAGSMMNHLFEYLKYYHIGVDGIINTENKAKSQALNRLKPQIFIDDSPFKLEKVINIEKNIFDWCEIILYRNKQNKVEPSPDPRIIEVRSWKEIYLFLKSYKNKE